MYEAITNEIRITVKPRYLPEQSRPEDHYFVWAYTIIISNESERTVTLKTRHWNITDAKGRSQEVQGTGVVGETPKLKPGDTFEYTSGAPLPTESGFMSGCYRMESDEGEAFDVVIPAFSLDSNDAPGHMH